MTEHLKKTQNDLHLLSPDFTPRPGWGGQLKAWFGRRYGGLRANIGTFFVRALVVIAIPASVGIIVRQFNIAMTSVTLTPEPSPSFVTVTVQAGEGLTHAARLALYEYMAVQAVPLALAPEQYVYAEDWLARRMAPHTTQTGQTIDFPHEVLAAAILRAQSLTPQERAAWLKYVK